MLFPRGPEHKGHRSPMMQVEPMVQQTQERGMGHQTDAGAAASHSTCLFPSRDMRVPGDENVAPESLLWTRYVRL